MFDKSKNCSIILMSYCSTDSMNKKLHLLINNTLFAGLRDIGKTSIIAVNGAQLIDSQLSSHDVATALLYYTTIPTR